MGLRMNNRIPNVLHLLLSLDVGGAERVVYSLLNTKSPLPVNHSVCCIDRKGVLAEELKNNGVPVYCIQRKPGIDLLLPFKIAKLAINKEINVIHAHGETPWFYSVLSLFITFGAFYKCITTIHGYSGGDNSSLVNKRLWRFLMFFSHKIVVVSKALESELKSVFILYKNKIETIINGINLKSSTSNQDREAWGISDELTMGVISRLSHVKNHKLLIHAFADLQVKYNVKLIIVGDGPERMYLENLIKRIGITSSVVFTGERTDAMSFYPLFDMFILPSFSEGISIALLEAMSSGTPVIASNVGGNTEIVSHLDNGLIFESNDRQDLINKIVYMLDYPDEATRMSLNAMNSTKNKFSAFRMVDSYNKQYYGMLRN